MFSLNRREILQLGGVSLGVGTAGCTSVGINSSGPPRLVKLTIGNHDPEPYTVYVMLLKDGEPVFWNVMDADAANPDTNRPGGGRLEGYPTEADSYVLYAWRDDQPRSDWQRFDFGDHDAECVGIYIQIGYFDSDTGELRIYRTYDCQVGSDNES